MNLFPDVSFWEGAIDFNVMRSKTDYIILKASQITVDHRFQEYRAGCESVGLPYGVYHFYDDRSSPKKQADLFCGLFRDKKPVEIFCDWETSYGGEFTGIKNVVAFMQECERQLGMEMGMYTGYWWFIENTNPVTHYSQLNYLKAKKLWLAAYNEDYTNTGIMFVKVPRPWTKMDIWQFSDRGPGREYGCNSEELDMNERLGDFPTIPNARGRLIIGNKVYKEQA